MITENLSTLKIHKLTQEQYDRELLNGTLDASALYFTPDEGIDLSGYTTKEETSAILDSANSYTDEQIEAMVGDETVADQISAAVATKADANHTHNYAGSSSAGGAATSANKLNTNAGSTTQPVYFANGVPVETTYTLGKSVPSDAVFTDTVYTHPSYTSKSAGLYKVTVDGTGHVSAATAVTKDDITALGIPAQDTDTVYTHPSSHPASMITGLADIATSGSIDDLEESSTKKVNHVVSAESSDGATFTATVDGITALEAGLEITIIPSMTATAASTSFITLDVNSLGARSIHRKLSAGTLTRPALMYANVLYKDTPVHLFYDGTYWVATQFTKPSATDLYGITAVANGGTGMDSLTAGYYLVGNGTEEVALKTPAEVLSDIGAVNKAGDTMTGALNMPAGSTVYGDSWPTLAFTNSSGDTVGYVQVSSSNRLILAQKVTGATYGERYMLPTLTENLTSEAWYRILTTKEVTYGTSLPAAGTAGRIFFKKVT